MIQTKLPILLTKLWLRIKLISPPILINKGKTIEPRINKRRMLKNIHMRRDYKND